ncbi:Bifunctional dehydrogenase and ferrochelatase [Ascosphaera pollenicola]|nr:Bifunctional dehydrogenase and ferrochelatase [Ascosphaera pollenicola]
MSPPSITEIVKEFQDHALYIMIYDGGALEDFLWSIYVPMNRPWGCSWCAKNRSGSEWELERKESNMAPLDRRLVVAYKVGNIPWSNLKKIRETLDDVEIDDSCTSITSTAFNSQVWVENALVALSQTLQLGEGFANVSEEIKQIGADVIYWAQTNRASVQAGEGGPLVLARAEMLLDDEVVNQSDGDDDERGPKDIERSNSAMEGIPPIDIVCAK